MVIPTPKPAELATIDEHGFKVTTSDENFVVRDPLRPKNGKLEGPNLAHLLRIAIDARRPARAPPPPKPEPQTSPPKSATQINAEKTSPLDWTTGQIGVLILRHWDKEPKDIFAMCQAQGINTKLNTVVGLTRYFRLCVRVLEAIDTEDHKV